MNEFLNKIICDDCLNILPQIPDNSIDFIFTDPPYNISQRKKVIRDGRTGKNMDINYDFGEWDYVFNPIPFLKESKRILKDNGSIIVWTSEYLYGKYREWFQKNMYPKQLLIWVKANPLPQFRLVGYRQATELLFWALKNKNTQDNENFIFQNQKEMTNVFYAPIVSGKERVEHPTQKPLSITEKILQTHCKKDGIVLDPFAGSGTTGCACEKLGRNYILIEKEKKYCDMANERIKDIRPKTNIFDVIT